MAIKKEKYINALVYFISQCGNEKLGITKLNKLFYYLDFISFRDRKESVTGEKYIRLPMGPFASHLQDEIIKEAENKKFISQIEDKSSKFGKRNRYQSLTKPNLLVFSEYEKKLLGYICSTFKDWSTDQMIAQTHSEAPWVFSEVNKPLNYENADDIEFFLKEKDSALA
jgi:uncharacterized phage-associated protein